MRERKESVHSVGYLISEILKTVMTYLMLIVIALLVLVPILWIVGSSFNNSSSLMSATMFPKEPTIRHYIQLFEETKFSMWYMNTLKIALCNMVISVIISLLTAYVFSRFQFKGKKMGLISILVLQMFPSFMGMMATYNILWQLNMLNTHIGLVLTYAAGQLPYNIWLIKGYLGSVPRSLDEAAKLDGAGNLQIFVRVIVPLTKPMITFVALTQFMSPWMDFIFPRMILTSKEKMTLAIGLYDLISSNTNNNFTMFAAGAVLVAVPITILYMCMQKYLIQGILAGANKV